MSNDFTDRDRWIRDCQLLVTYVAGPYADDHQTDVLRDWIADGGRWLALHGSTGGKAERLNPEGTKRRMAKMSYHEAPGGFFMTHPPIREFQVDVPDRNHVLTHNLPESFRVKDEPYMIEVLLPETRVLLSTSEVAPPPPETQELYGGDTSLLPDGESRALGFVRDLGEGAVAYIAPGHCHTPTTGQRAVIDESLFVDGERPMRFRGPWKTDAYENLLRNAVAWGTGVEG